MDANYYPQSSMLIFNPLTPRLHCKRVMMVELWTGKVLENNLGMKLKLAKGWRGSEILPKVFAIGINAVRVYRKIIKQQVTACNTFCMTYNYCWCNKTNLLMSKWLYCCIYSFPLSYKAATTLTLWYVNITEVQVFEAMQLASILIEDEEYYCQYSSCF